MLAKTAIHPSQLDLIHSEYRVSAVEYYEANAILDANAKSVFKVHGSMLEPATHHNWAKGIIRAELYGVIETHLQMTNDRLNEEK